jgi:hypothetical protein
MPFQILGMAITGLTGGLYRKHLQSYSSARFCIEVAVLGAFLTMLYDLITNFGVALQQIVVGVPPLLAVITALAYGTLFSLIHISSNIAVFGIIFLPLTKALNSIMVVKNFG